MKPPRTRKRIAEHEQNEKGKKGKAETGSDGVTNNEATKKCTSIEISHSTDQEIRRAVEEIRRVFSTSAAESKAIVDLARGLQPDDPAVFITFGTGDDVRNSLRSTFAGMAAATNRPCNPGNNGDEALQNLKNWMQNQLPGTNETVQESTPLGLAIGSLTQAEYNALTLTLSFMQPPAVQWGIANAANNRSLGGLIGITGTGIGSAAISILPSMGFRG